MKVLDIVVNLWTSDLTTNYTPKLNSFWQKVKTLDRVAIDFPELTIIGIHIGYPWVEEMISVAWKYPNVYVGCDAHAPSYWDPSFVRFINSRRGRDKVLFGTDWPVVDFSRATTEIHALELKPESKQQLLSGNAIKVSGLEDWK